MDRMDLIVTQCMGHEQNRTPTTHMFTFIAIKKNKIYLVQRHTDAGILFLFAHQTRHKKNRFLRFYFNKSGMPVQLQLQLMN